MDTRPTLEELQADMIRDFDVVWELLGDKFAQEGITRNIALVFFGAGFGAGMRYGTEWQLEQCRRNLSSHLRALHGTAN